MPQLYRKCHEYLFVAFPTCLSSYSEHMKGIVVASSRGLPTCSLDLTSNMSKSPITCHSQSLQLLVANQTDELPVLDSSTGRPAPNVLVSLTSLSAEEGKSSELAQGYVQAFFDA